MWAAPAVAVTLETEANPDGSTKMPSPAAAPGLSAAAPAPDAALSDALASFPALPPVQAFAPASKIPGNLGVEF